MHVLALDVGTSSVKAALLDTASAQATGPIVRVAYELDQPAPEASQVPAERLWQAIAAAGKQATRGQPDAQAVGLSVMTPALVLLDAADRPVLPIRTHLDRRARPAARQVMGGGRRRVPRQRRQSAVARRHQRHRLAANAQRGSLPDPPGEELSASERLAGAAPDRPAGLRPRQRQLQRTLEHHDGSALVGTLVPLLRNRAGLAAGSEVRRHDHRHASAPRRPPSWACRPACRSSSAPATPPAPCCWRACVPAICCMSVGTTQVLATLANQPRPNPRR